MPGGKPMHFCVEVMQMSTPSASTSIFVPPIELTVSMHQITSGYFFITSAIASTGHMTPDEVSLCVIVIRSYLPVASVSSTMSGVVA